MLDVTKVAENIQKICREKGVTPTVVGRESGAGKDLVTNMKKKGTRPSIERIRLVADYLGVSVAEILGEDNVVYEEEIGEYKKAVLTKVENMTEGELALLLERIEKIIKMRD